MPVNQNSIHVKESNGFSQCSGVFLPGLAVGLHVVGGGDVVGPDVVLPLEEAEDAAEDAPRVDPHPHVQLHVRRLHHVAARARRERDVA